jgi:hypothetical protein
MQVPLAIAPVQESSQRMGKYHKNYAVRDNGVR